MPREHRGDRRSTRLAAPTTIVELQPFRDASSVALPGAGVATLIDLNPHVNDWYVLSLRVGAVESPVWYHLENPDPDSQTLTLDPEHPNGIRLTVERAQHSTACCGMHRATARCRARRTPVCHTRPSATTGSIYATTWPEHTRGSNGSPTFFGTGSGAATGSSHSYAGHSSVMHSSSAPSPKRSDSTEAPRNALNVPVAATIDRRVRRRIGRSTGPRYRRWQRSIAAHRRVVCGRRCARHVRQRDRTACNHASVLSSYPNDVAPLDAVESHALDYLVAMDLAQFDVAFVLGTDHPRVGWSPRALDSVRDPNLRGPDGIDSVAPLVVNGLVNPVVVGRTAATFTGGFKREHGAFRYGALAQQNRGTPLRLHRTRHRVQHAAARARDVVRRSRTAR